MIRLAVLAFALFALLLMPTGALHAAPVYLAAGFDDKPLDTPIGNGGATVGEPVSVSGSVTAIVRSAPFGTPSLEIADVSATELGHAVFRFLGNRDLRRGDVTASMDLWFSESEDYLVWFQEAYGFSHPFLNLSFRADGQVRYRDSDSPSTAIGTYARGRVVSLVVIFHLDAGTYDVRLNGTPVLLDESHGVTAVGLGSVAIGTLQDADVIGTVCVDNLRVSAGSGTTAIREETWARLKALYR